MRLARTLTLGLLLIFPAAGFAAAPADRSEAKALVEELLARAPQEDSQILGLLKVRAAEGAITETPIRMLIRVSGNSWEDVYETQPAEGRPGEMLIIRRHRGRPNEYLYGQYRKLGEAASLERLTGPKLFQALAGSDFFFADLGLEFLHWPSQKIVKREMRKSRSCRVVESINPKPAAGTYARVLSWIDVETGNLILAQGYDARNRLLKEFSVRKISRNQGTAQLKEIEMRNEQTDSRSRLEFNLDLPAETAVGDGP